MASLRDGGLARSIGILYDAGASGGLSDAQLLERVAAGGEAAASAFEAIVARHGPMVLGVCRRALDDPHDASDAFQATFLVLARRARSIREGDALASWLFGVARRVCDRARTAAARRRLHERRAADRMGATQPDDHRDYAALHEEVARLPERYRLPVVLCYLEGLTYEAAADRLRCPLGTLSIRLSRARDRLRSRLVRRGLTASAGLLIASGTASACLSDGLAATTSRLALRFLGDRAMGGGEVPAAVAGLAKGVLDAMRTTTRLKVLAGILGLATIAGVGAGALARGGRGPGDDPKAEAAPAGDLAKLQGTWAEVDPASVNKEVISSTWTIAGTRLTNRTKRVNGSESEHVSAVRLDGQSTPPGIDLVQHTRDAGGEHESVHRCLYKIDGDTLILCGPLDMGAPRPAAFGAEGTVTIVLRRAATDEAKDASAPVQDDLARLQGTWDVVDPDGKATTKTSWWIRGAAKLVRVTEADGTVTEYGGRIRLDERAEPRAIDIRGSTPEDSSVTRGIYRVARDELTVCLGLLNAPRPAEFRGVGGESPTRLISLRRRPVPPTAAAVPRTIEGDLATLQGAWVQVDPGLMNKDVVWAAWEVIDKTLIHRTRQVGGSENEHISEIELNERLTPRGIDLVRRSRPVSRTGVRGEERDVVVRCIYKIDGDMLTVSVPRGADQPRPRAFGGEGSETTVLRRPARAPEPAGPAEDSRLPSRPAVRGDLARLQGSWVAEAVGPEGKTALTMTFAGDVATSTSAGPSETTRLNLKITLDESARPPAFDMATVGLKPTHLIGIYRIEGDTFTIHMTTPDKPRPTDFTADDADPHAVIVFRRKPGR